jgi:hypothetical protein
MMITLHCLKIGVMACWYFLTLHIGAPPIQGFMASAVNYTQVLTMSVLPKLSNKAPHRWLMTYDDSPFIRERYSFATIEPWQLQYGMNNYKQAQAAKGEEIFIKNYA